MKITYIVSIIVIVTILLQLEKSRMLGIILNKKRCKHRMFAFYRRGYIESLEKEPGFHIYKILESKVILYNKTTDNLVSCSLYGTHPTYWNGALNLINTVNSFGPQHPQWKVRIYIHKNVEYLANYHHLSKIAEVYVVEDPLLDDVSQTRYSSAGALWRFHALFETDMNVAIMDVDINTSEITDFLTNCRYKPYDIIKGSTFPWPMSHTQAGYLYLRKNALITYFEKKGYTLSDVYSCIQKMRDNLMNYPHRSTFGSDEIYTTREWYDIMNTLSVYITHHPIGCKFLHLFMGKAIHEK